MKGALLDNLNRQYCWLLVSAYEEYERLLKNLYARMGFLDRAFWKCDDYGDISPSEIAKKNLAWFRDRVRNNVKLRHDVSYALRQFRQAFPRLQSYEARALAAGRMSVYANGILQQTIDTLPLEMTCRLAEKLRHAIVHDQGSVDSIESLCSAIGVKGQEKEGVIASHVKNSREGVRIWLVNDADGMLDGRFLSLRIHHLLESLNAHGCLVYKSCMVHFGQKPFWERSDSRGK
jgi:hypothetical protein